MDFEISPEESALIEVARDVARKLAPGYVERDRDEFDWDLLHALGDAQLLGVHVPEEMGGQGASAVVAGMVVEELGVADSATTTMSVQASTSATLLHTFAHPAIAADWVPRILSGQTTISLGFTEEQSGSDLANLRTTATRDGDGWLINGEKQSISLMPSSSAMVVLARSDEGPVLLFVRTDSAGLTSTRIPSLGRRPAGRSIVHFDNVAVPGDQLIGDPKQGLRAVLASLGHSRLLVGMGLIGMGRGAVDETRPWIHDRITFGRPLAERQGVAFPLVDHLTNLEMARLLCLKGLWLADQGRDYRVESAMVKAFVPRAVFDLVHECLLIFGHAGYSLDNPMQLRLRDIMAAELGEGPANIQRLILSRHLLGANPN
jgi:cyclohexanecarboxyl-CoA dehydrogenase